MIARFFLVCLGGALGSGARYATALWAASAFGVAFPFGTLIVNVAGSFVIGAVMELLPPSELRLFLTAGVLGGFTTYSSFNEETLRLLRGGMPGSAMMNFGATVAGCLIAGIAGAAAARMIR
jgi:CrcB protein